MRVPHSACSSHARRTYSDMLLSYAFTARRWQMQIGSTSHVRFHPGAVYHPGIHKRATVAGRWSRLFGAAALVALLCISNAHAQFRTLWNAEEVAAEAEINLFARWEGRTVLDGVWVELPRGWSLHHAEAVRRGYERIALRIERLPDNAYRLRTPSGPLGAHDLVLRVTTGGMGGDVEWTLTPLMVQQDRQQPRLARRETYRASRRVVQRAAMPAGDNQVLAFDTLRAAPLLVRRAAVPDLDPATSYTVELWMKTTQTKGVVLSTWDGDEQTAYPLELVVDATGRLFYYRGQPGEHTSMKTTRPVADGQWHHVAVAHNGASGWTRLLLDGVATDSLFMPTPPSFRWETPLALGGRVPAKTDRENTAGAADFVGWLDEVRIWPQARATNAIHRTMHQPVNEAGADGLVLHFDEEIPDTVIEQHTDRARRVYADLSFFYPIRHFRATPQQAEHTVVLSWDTHDRRTESFVVERSLDGTTFEPIGEVAGRQATGSEDGSATYYTFVDDAHPEQVAFYRIRQRLKGGSERLSSTIKLGFGLEREASTFLVGNFPNPFVRETTIGYEVRANERVNLSVWDLSGQQVAALVNRDHEPGYYQVQFSADDLPSGTYFVRLQTPSGIQTRKMILAK